jgi:hypothetical protein
MKLTFCVVSDLYRAGRTEDGRDFVAETYFVEAEDEAGNVWRHHARFNGCQVTWDAEDGVDRFADVRETAEANAERLLARIQAAGGRIDLAHWTAGRPAYGSPAYQAYGQHDDWMEEQMDRANGL